MTNPTSRSSKTRRRSGDDGSSQCSTQSSSTSSSPSCSPPASPLGTSSPPLSGNSNSSSNNKPQSRGGILSKLRLRKQQEDPHHHHHVSSKAQQQHHGHSPSKNHHNNNNSNNNNQGNVKNWIFMAITILGWYLVGVVAICTTKILFTEFHVPPLVLTVQQLFMGSMFLRTILVIQSGGARPWPVVHYNHNEKDHNNKSSSSNDLLLESGNAEAAVTTNRWSLNKWMHRYIYETAVNIDFILAGLFHSLDFLASNTAFNGAAASFVETIKASEPITTTIVALLWKIDVLKLSTEGMSLGILIGGVLLSTIGNSEESEGDEEAAERLPPMELAEPSSASASLLSSFSLNPATVAALTVMTANLCYAFRALSQKRFRAWEKQQIQQNPHTTEPPLDDINLLCRMLLAGAYGLSVPAVLFYGGQLYAHISMASPSTCYTYLGYAVVNTCAYATYNLASTYVLSKLSVLQHSSLNCLRRMFCTIATGVYFGVSWSPTEIMGIVLCFSGFLSFTHFRAQRNDAAKQVATPPSSLPTTTQSKASTGCENNNVHIINTPPPAVTVKHI